ncbi:MAG: bifunctional riboflavin kinase/FAD synthetase [Syntrophobacteraceae bacterium]
MDVFVGIENVCRPLRNPVLTIGNFDGVHRGHEALFQRVKEWARKLNGESVVVTFHPHPLEVLSPGNGPSFITAHERKLELIEAAGIDAAIVIPFTKDFAEISAEDFVKDLLVGRLGVKAIVVGYDYRFGRGREGDIDFLKEKGREFGFEVDTVSGISIDGTMVSSTIIRRFIQDGRIDEAGKLLGRYYEISGLVVHGRSRGGRLLGFPTANIRMPSLASPRNGIYAAQVDVDGVQYGGAANLGYNPTFGDEELSLEVYILDFDRDIYGKTITVRFIERLRDEKRFSGPEELKAQISKDVERAREILRHLDPID